MAQGAITIRSVTALPPGTTLWDTGLRGFGVRRQTDTAAYVIKYRQAGRQHFYTIGPHGPWTPETARKEAKRLLGQAAGAKDLQADRRGDRSKAADTVGRVATEYLSYAKKRQKPRSYSETARHLLVNWKPLHS